MPVITKSCRFKSTYRTESDFGLNSAHNLILKSNIEFKAERNLGAKPKGGSMQNF